MHNHNCIHYNLPNFCTSKVKNGIIIRYIITIIVFYLLSINFKANDERIYLILPILLLALDNVDNIFTFN